MQFYNLWYPRRVCVLKKSPAQAQERKWFPLIDSKLKSSRLSLILGDCSLLLLLSSTSAEELKLDAITVEMNDLQWIVCLV